MQNVASGWGFQEQSDPEIEAKVSHDPFFKNQRPPQCSVEKTEPKDPWPPGEIEITPGTFGSLVTLESRAPKGGGALWSSWGKGPFQA